MCDARSRGAVSKVCSGCGFLPEGTRPAWVLAFGASPRAVFCRLGQQEFDTMKKLLVAASMAAGLAAGAVPALAQSTPTGQGDWTVSAANGAGSWVEAPNYNRLQAAISNEAYVGRGSASDYLRQQQELQNMPGYSVGGNG